MRNSLTIALLFIGTIIVDSILLPGLFHIYGGLLTFAFLAALLVVYGNTSKMIIIGALGALLLETWHGFYFGSVILAWLGAAALWQALAGFFNIEPLCKHGRIDVLTAAALVGIGYILIASMSIIFMIVEKYLYQPDISWMALRLTALSPLVWLVTGCGIVLCMLAMRWASCERTGHKEKFYI